MLICFKKAFGAWDDAMLCPWFPNRLSAFARRTICNSGETSKSPQNPVQSHLAHFSSENSSQPQSRYGGSIKHHHHHPPPSLPGDPHPCQQSPSSGSDIQNDPIIANPSPILHFPHWVGPRNSPLTQRLGPIISITLRKLTLI